ncbi:MAG: hypothetical protein IPO92_06445 [Saprospiraceae bacterium]|nr:hypothetical protein [Saprospiraceae bacterium]
MNKLKYFVVSIAVIISAAFIYSCAKENNSNAKANIDPKVELRATNYIGEFINGLPVITVNENDMISAWETFLSNQDIEADFTTVAIEQYGSEYYVVARGNSVKSTRKVIIDVNGTDLIGDVTVTCTSTGACATSTKCVPTGMTCTACDGSGTCSKTVSN